MRAKAWWALAVALGGCGGTLEEDGVPLHEEPLGTDRAEIPQAVVGR